MVIFLLLPGFSFSQNSEVRFSGSMRNTMRMGKIQRTISLDTISNKSGLCGIGPLENLQGEIMMLDGESYVSRVNGKAGMEVKPTFDAGAPFFVYANAEHWKEYGLPKFVSDLSSLEKFLSEKTEGQQKPFVFKLSGKVVHSGIHVVNLPEGRTVSSPEEAHEGMVHFEIENENCDIIGFFSTKHQGVFTHHDTFMHLHLINSDRNKMGHVETLTFQPGMMVLYLAD